jgi:hypothetical protein
MKSLMTCGVAASKPTTSSMSASSGAGGQQSDFAHHAEAADSLVVTAW